MRASVDYMNARRAHRVANGGTNYALRDRVANAADIRARDAELDQWDRAMAVVDAIFADFRAFCREGSSAAAAAIAGFTDRDVGDEIPF